MRLRVRDSKSTFRLIRGTMSCWKRTIYFRFRWSESDRLFVKGQPPLENITYQAHFQKCIYTAIRMMFSMFNFLRLVLLSINAFILKVLSFLRFNRPRNSTPAVDIELGGTSAVVATPGTHSILNNPNTWCLLNRA